MATISSALRINNQMTAPLITINNSINTVINNLERMGSVGDSAVNGTSQAFKGAASEADKFKDKVKDIGDESTKSNEKLGKMLKTALSFHVAEKVFRTVANAAKSVMASSDQMTGTNTQLDYVSEQFAQKDKVRGIEGDMKAKIMAVANSSRADYMETAQAVSQLGSFAANAFSSSDEMIAMADQINKSFVLAGADSATRAGATRQLMQGLSSGTLRGDEYNSIAEGAPMIKQAIGEYLSEIGAKNKKGDIVNTSNLRNYAAEGKITADVVKNALLSAADEVNDRFNSMPMTFEQMGTVIKNKSYEVFAPIQQVISDAFNGGTAEKIIGGVQSIMNVVAGVIGFITKHIEGITLALKILAVFIGAVTAVLLIAKLATIGHAISLIFAAVVHKGAAKAKLADAAAQWGLNAAILASPITWIIAGIIAVIAVIVVLVGHFKKSESTLGSLFGGIRVGLSWCWNAIKKTGEFFMNIGSAISLAWNKLVNSIQVKFWGMVNSIVSMAEPLLILLGKLFGFDGKEVIATVKMKYDEALQTQEELEKGEADGTYGWGSQDGKLNAFSDGWKDIAWRKGYDAGAGIENAVKENQDDLFSYDPAALLADSGSIDTNTAATAKNTKQQSEDLSFLRDLAEMEVVNRFTAAEIKVDMSGMSNAFHNGQDFDGFLDVLTNAFGAAVSSGAQGVYD
jgi:tape measure domain-containing protein